MNDFERSILKQENHAMVMRFAGAVMRGLFVRYWPAQDTDAVAAAVVHSRLNETINPGVPRTSWKSRVTYG